jgi:ABC-type phosphate/phosphonate transport system substrate-binding protein
VAIRVWAVAALLAAVPSVHATDPELPKIRVGMLENMFRDVPKPILIAMSEPFRGLMLKQTGLTGDVEFCPNSTCLAGKLKDRSVTVGVFHGFEYAWAKAANPNLQPILVTVPHGRKVQAMIVVKNEEKKITLADLKGPTVVTPKGLKAHAQLFLDRIRTQNPGIQLAPKSATLTAEEALTAVATGEQKAAITDIATLNGYMKLQPGAANQLRIVAESELFPVAVIATCKGTLADEHIERVRNGLAGASKTAQGRTMLTMWSLKGFEPAPADYDDQCKKILAFYPPPDITPSTAAAITPDMK